MRGNEVEEPENLDVAGLPSVNCNGPGCHEWPESHESRECLESPECLESRESPVSNGQGLEAELKGLAARNACTCAGDSADRKRFKLARDVTAIEKRIGRALTPDELTRTLDQWYWLSGSYAGKTREHHLENFFAELTKVRVATGEGDTINKALASVSKLSASELPAIPGMPGAPESWQRIAALHGEVSRLCANRKYFLSYRDAAKVYDGLSQQSAHTITFALARLRVIRIVSRGKANPNGGKAAEFKYLLLETEEKEP